jgi:hypothetical protein
MQSIVAGKKKASALLMLLIALKLPLDALLDVSFAPRGSGAS